MAIELVAGRGPLQICKKVILASFRACTTVFTFTQIHTILKKTIFSDFQLAVPVKSLKNNTNFTDLLKYLHSTFCTHNFNSETVFQKYCLEFLQIYYFC